VRWPNYYNQYQKPIIIRERTPDRKKRFRWEIVVVPAILIFFILFLREIEFAGTWNDFLNAIEIDDKRRFTQLFVLGVLACAICAIFKVLKNNKTGK
jgi:uncharacterized membrane protein YbhN (UPF0104 family)